MERLVFRGPLVPEIGEIKDEKLPYVVEKLLFNRCGIFIEPSQDLEHVELRLPSEFYPKSILVKFTKINVRNEIWESRQSAKKNGLLIDEWLTENRARLFRKCKELKAMKLIKDCYTDYGQVWARPLTKPGT